MRSEKCSDIYLFYNYCLNFLNISTGFQLCFKANLDIINIYHQKNFQNYGDKFEFFEQKN